jgi:hypothetical protein
MNWKMHFEIWLDRLIAGATYEITVYLKRLRYQTWPKDMYLRTASQWEMVWQCQPPGGVVVAAYIRMGQNSGRCLLLMSACCEHSNEAFGAIKGVEFLWPKWMNLTEYCGRICSNPAWYPVVLAFINLGPKTNYIKISHQYNGTTLLVRCDVFAVSHWRSVSYRMQWCVVVWVVRLG